MRIAGIIAACMLLVGCAVVPAESPAAAQAPGQVFVGEVWTWDEPNSIVTLRQGGRTIRVKVTPDQLQGLRLHETARLRGEPAPPAEIATVVGPTGPTRAVPRGAARQAELTGTVTSVDPGGRLALASARGPLHVWVAPDADQRFRPGLAVRVRMTVQPVDLVPVGSAAAPPAVDPAASPGAAPADHAVVTGRLIGVHPTGTVIAESPTGPVQVWVEDPSGLRVGDAVQVRTTVQPVP